MTKAWASWSYPHCLRLHLIRLHRVRSQQAVTMLMIRLPIPPVPHPCRQTGRSVRAAHPYDLSTLASIPTQPPLLSHSMGPAAGNKVTQMGARHPIKVLLEIQLQKTRRRSRNSHQRNPNLSSHLLKAPHLSAFSHHHRGFHTSAMVPQPLHLKTLALERSAAEATQKHQSKSC
jgi:hypothetical protein